VPYKKFAKDVSIIGFSQLLVSLSTFILLSVLTKILGPYQYGLWVQLTVTILLIYALIELGLPFSMNRFLAAEKNQDEIREGFYSILIIVLLISLSAGTILYIFSEPLSHLLFDDIQSAVQMIAIIIPPWSVNMVYCNYFRTFREMKKYASIIVVEQYLEVGLIILLLLKGYNFVWAATPFLFIRTSVSVYLFFYIRSKIGFSFPRFSHLKEYLQFGLPTIPGNISLWIIASSNRYIITILLGTIYVGYYSPGYSIGIIPITFIGFVGFVLPPTVSKLYDEDGLEEVKNHLSYSLKYFLLIAIPFVFGSFFLSKSILKIITTPQIANEGYLVMPLVALSCIPFGIYTIVMNVFVSVKKTKLLGILWSISAILNIVFNIIFILYIGIIGAAIATIIAYLVVFAGATYFSRKEFKFSLQSIAMGKSIIASLIMSLFLYIFQPTGIISVALSIIIGAGIYFTTLFILKTLTTEEMRFVKSIIQITQG
jgi:O-antigen/teichoic acid export membrane protein